MLKSMTAFAGAEKTDGKISAEVEIRSFNSKYLDLSLRLYPASPYMEEKIRELIANEIARGRIEITVRFNDESEETRAFDIDEPKAAAYYNALVLLKERFALDTKISLELLLGIGNIIKPVKIEQDMDAVWPVVRGSINDALDKLNLMRKREGSHIAEDIGRRLEFIELNVDRIEKETDGLLSHYHKRLKERIMVLTENVVEIDSERIVQEAALLADKSDISEEISRTKSHIKQFRLFMNSEESAGRKLNFLLQEFNREFNTMGAKVGYADLLHLIIDLRSELEKIREQIQNVE